METEQQLRADMVVELAQEEIINYFLSHPSDCEYAVYLRFDSSTELLDKHGRSGVIVISAVGADDLLHFIPQKAPWWKPLRPLVAYLELRQIFTGRVFGIPICVPELTKNPVLGKYVEKPKPSKLRKVAKLVRINGVELKIGMIGPVPYFELKLPLQGENEHKK